MPSCMQLAVRLVSQQRLLSRAQLEHDQRPDRQHRREGEGGPVHEHPLATGFGGHREVLARDVLGPELGRAPGLPRAEGAVPEAAQGAEGVVAGLEAFVMPVVVVRHLREGQPAMLQRVGDVEVAAHARVLFEALEDAENVREPEGGAIQWHQDLGEAVAHDR
eukprot:CAMPEP_0168384098 /NCGR_PEP_ID=MMETSP0228-20121227/14237_1 /TAXON_ID=133427 /ORGANISM="Protoceratium reticulatum, Strain CCCM 535 (=CCMP 1889)" /LENGTH=162 /DNA_ID=CAMNT_0008397257 /DNA_START=173 /DNA_END=658 /DNA_ORIENTATION=-